MTTAPPASASRAVGAVTIAEAFRITAEDHPDRVAVRTKDDELSLTWRELRDRVDALACGLHELGVRRGDTVALMLANRPEFHIADLAAMTLGATPFSIYATLDAGPDRLRRRRRGREGGDRRGAFSGAFLAARDRLPALETCSCSRAGSARGPSGGPRSRRPGRTSTSMPRGARSSPTTSSR